MIKSITHFYFFLIALCVVTQFNTAHAEKADSFQPLRIWAESQTYDGNKKITIYTGSVHLKKGTLDIYAARLEVVEDNNGGKVGTLFGSPGKLVTYRQKRDGGPDLWAEGEAEKVVYNDTLEKIKLFNQAKLILLDGKKRTHESSGIYISYDSRTDFMSVNNTLQGVSAPGAGFTNAIIYPVEGIQKHATNPAYIPPMLPATPAVTEHKPTSDRKSETQSETKSDNKSDSSTLTPKKMQEVINE